MKQPFLVMMFLVSILCSSATSCEKNDDNTTENITPMANGKIKIKVGLQTFTATLLDNNSAKAFKEMLPMTINMIELNNNEKYYDLPNSLPTNSSNPATIKNGDLMLYGSKLWCCFTKLFPRLTATRS